MRGFQTLARNSMQKPLQYSLFYSVHFELQNPCSIHPRYTSLLHRASCRGVISVSLWCLICPSGAFSRSRYVLSTAWRTPSVQGLHWDSPLSEHELERMAHKRHTWLKICFLLLIQHFDLKHQGKLRKAKSCLQSRMLQGRKRSSA